MQGIVFIAKYAPLHDIKTPTNNIMHLKYIACKYRECEFNKGCSHSLWGILPDGTKGNINDLKNATHIMRDVSSCKTVHRAILSLDAETADAKDFNCRTNWQALCERRVLAIAKEYDIKPENFCYLASFHYKSGHPHIHMMYWDKSDEIHKEGMSNQRFEIASEKIREKFNKDIFAEELSKLYADQDNFKKDIKLDFQTFINESTVANAEDITEELNKLFFDENIEDYIIDNKLPTHTLIDDDLETIYLKLSSIISKLPTNGSLDYKYLPPELKKEIDVLSHFIIKSVPSFETRYKVFFKTVDDVSTIYGSGYKTKQMHTEGAKNKLYTDMGNLILKHLKSNKETIDFINNFAQQINSKPEFPILHEHLKISAELDNDFANYTLGKQYLYGDTVEKNIPKAIEHLKTAAKNNNQYAQYTLGMMHLKREVGETNDKDAARQWFTLSAEQGNENAAYMLEHMDDYDITMQLNIAARLVVSLSRLFRENRGNNTKDYLKNLSLKDNSETQRKNLRKILAGKSGMNWGDEYGR